MKMDNVTGSVVAKVAVSAVGILLVYLLIIKPIFRRLGIIQTPEDKKRDEQAKQASTSSDSPWSPLYYQSRPGALLLTKAATLELAKQINDAIGFFTDDETEVYGALRQLKAKTQLSWLCQVFFDEYKTDMYQLLNRNLGDDEMDIIHGIADQLK